MENHDIIFIKRTGRWVCKCGDAGQTKSSMEDHIRVVQLEQDVHTFTPQQHTEDCNV